ncbi:MAG: hypothetical protein QN152_08155 [Armatimonadota bacterium]|nr:hypothetical protein [Armatimonadota bacterium]MDR7427420.1 hypothetical protein [Armatimonadota bacterium]MDR7464573.1 hypothetical protein [Armatimonadota bacterium]MDR7470756.1 hypothetical protein [Armatimonadota bacterium]MDR7474999.1 hypothetical protein [Armatimonadota bacterium]
MDQRGAIVNTLAGQDGFLPESTDRAFTSEADAVITATGFTAPMGDLVDLGLRRYGPGSPSGGVSGFWH